MPKSTQQRPLIQHWKPAKLWGRHRPHLSAQDWVLNTQSLTAKIRQFCPQMKVEVLFEGQALPLPSESAQLHCRTGETVWVRCVLLTCDTTPIIYARTVIPQMQSGNPWFAIKRLGNQPLGEVLFKSKKIHRTAFSWLKSNQVLCPSKCGTLLGRENFQKRSYWARQSKFTKAHATLLLTEVFLQLAV
ncbi:chorismate--pyruvate lyase family protein [Thiosulfativibrio zosterae]|uniref:Probable chorismate pyruvate-lyase n=1 Tax=Thiosulfativibrio zosterae TaxID=2675053 RepID=A0A6F8PK09_9GAMM|nr:chorismate lyase [Thiosulfativibrio zosterae]BBP42408.1 putative chorismate pyruvate-lyase [Thiosulfativibrio zosterae]